MGPNQIYKLLYRMGENVCKWYDWQGLNFQIIQIAHKSQQQKKNKEPNKKLAEGLNDITPKNI